MIKFLEVQTSKTEPGRNKNYEYAKQDVSGGLVVKNQLSSGLNPGDVGSIPC